MATIASAPPALSGELSLFYTTDPLLSNAPILVFHGPAATIGATSSRIQVHIFSSAGWASYARLAVSPNSPFYSAVSNLPREEQGDELCRGLAFALKKYFEELSTELKKIWCALAKAPLPSALFGDEHVAILATRMAKVENVEEVIDQLKHAFGEQRMSWMDVDVVLPCGSIKEYSAPADDSEDLDDSQLLAQRYGKYAEIIDALGETTFLPTSKMKRAPSKSSSVGRSASFLRHQKENVRKELCELLETEESYVSRITELRETAENCVGSGAESEQLRSVFPSNIDEIVTLNGEFLNTLTGVIDGTQQHAIQDIEAMTDEHPTANQARQDFTSDTQGISAVADCLVEWFPKFSESYKRYLKVHGECARLLSKAIKEEAGRPLQEIGEQKLTSLLIEPVQRLPRYSLYIDSIVKQLPVRHAAIKSLLRGRDIISSICDSSGTDPGSTAEILQSRISNWPSGLQVGRVVTAADYVELTPPYTEVHTAERGMLVLLNDAILFLRKDGSTGSAKTLLTEIDTGRPVQKDGLCFVRKIGLDAVDVLECYNGEALHVLFNLRLHQLAYPAKDSFDSSQVFQLEGNYERKAERLAEEISKARIEGRFSESERESHKWEVRSCDPMADTISLFSAIFEDSNPDNVAARTFASECRIVIDIDRHTQKQRAGEKGIRTVVAISPQRDGLWRLTFDTIDGTVGREHTTASDLITTLRRRLTALTATRFNIEQPQLTACLLSRYIDILQSLNVQMQPDDELEPSSPSKRDRLLRPKSPKKMLTSFWSSTGPGSQSPAVLKKDLPPLPPPVSRSSSFQSGHSKPPSRESRPSSKEQPTPKPLASMRSLEQISNPIKKLEETLSAYMLALQARKGNIVGRSLKMRTSADELAVNELYNSLIEDSNMMILAAQAPVDVLFAAFEKFLQNAWKEQVGQILPYSTLQDIQAKAETLFPVDFDSYFKTTMGSFPPQNQRAFKAVMTLLADLLDGTGNDGDRGILTAAFAEVLVTEGNPHDYIALIDRFVDDPDTYFGEPLEEAHKVSDGAFNPHKRARSINSASISSNTSSLRRKFGFGGLSRENSKSEQESKVASVWRSLSKSARGEASPANSISKGSLHRSYSTDMPPPRPASQDGSASLKSTLAEDLSFSGLSSQLNHGLSTIGEHPSFIPKGPPKKKRRSSLSDLPNFDSPGQKSPAWSPQAARRPPVTQRYMDEKSLPNSPMPSTPSSKGGSGRFGSPPKETPRSRLPPSFRTENSHGVSKAYATTLPEQRPKSSGSKPDDVVITSRPATSGIPTLTPKPLSPQKRTSQVTSRTGLAERPGAGNIIKKPSPPADKPQSTSTPAATGSPMKRLRMQSPQKLRERLQNEQSAINSAQASLQDELSKIGDELTATPSRIGSVRTSSHIRSKSNASSPPTNMDLAQRVLKLEGQLTQKVDEMTTNIQRFQHDISSSLTVAENKNKKLDELYKEANGENEALYARFNDELNRILKAVKGGESVEEMKKQLKEHQEELAKLRRENSRLKREGAGLRAQLKE